MHDSVDPPSRLTATLRGIAITAAIAVLVWLLHAELLLIFLAALLAILLHGLAAALSRWTGLPEKAALALIVLLVLLAAGGGAALAGPAILRQSQQMADTVAQQVKALRGHYGQSSIGRYLFSHLSTAAPSGQPAVRAAGSAFDAIGAAVVLVVATLYFAINPGIYVRGLIRLVPLSYRPRARAILDEIGQTLWYWLIGQGISMLVVGVLAGVGLGLLGVPLPVLLGLLTGLLTFIPYFGAVAAAIPSVLLALTEGGRTALYALGIYVGCHVVEGYIVAPLVQKRMVELPPAVTVLSLTIFGSLFGPLGIITATPLAAAAIVAVSKAYVADTLGDPEM